MSENEKEKNDKTGEEETITLDAKTYNALLDHLDELEKQGKGKEGKQKDQSYENYEDLVRAGKESGRRQIQPINEMSNEELVGLIGDQLDKNAITPMAVAIEGLRLDMEFMRLSNRKGFEDVEDIRDDILKVISENPNLNVEKAYKLVRVDKPKSKGEETKPEKGESARTVAAKLNLPGRVHSEKPGMANTGTKKAGPVTIRDAAEETLNELGID